MRTRDGVNVAGDFLIAPKDTGLQRSIIPVGQVCDTGNIITFRSTGGTILNEFSCNRIEFECVGGVYRLRAYTSAKMKSGTDGAKMLMGFEQDTAGAAEAQPAPVLPSESEVEQHELTETGAGTAYVPRARKARTMRRVRAAFRSSPSTCSWVRMERQSPS